MTNTPRWNPDVHVLAWLRLLGIAASDVRSVQAMEGGLLNAVYRIRFEDGSAILKWTPPYVASAPEIPLSDSRALFERSAMSAHVRQAATGPVCVPRLLKTHDNPRLTLMEDVGSGPDLGQRLPDIQAVTDLGAWLATLHGNRLASHWNHDVQAMRRLTQYEVAGDWMSQAGVPDAEHARTRYLEMATRWEQEGPCLLHGDLWPPSVLFPSGQGRAYVIDWEFSTMGWPAQDLGHLNAHLIIKGDAIAATHVPAFRAAYEHAADTAVLRAVSNRDLALHTAAEIGMRTFGPFRDAPSRAETARRAEHMRRLVNTATY